MARVLASRQLVFEKVRFAVLDGSSTERAVRFVTAFMVVLGLWLRCRGYLFSTMPLWLDEANWAMRLIDKPLIEHLIRPIGFMAVSKALVSIFAPSETVLRFLPWCAGIATVLMAPPLAARLFRSGAARLLFIGILCLHPAAIDLTKEFKPYSCGLALHAGLVLLALRYTDSGKVRDLVWVLAVIGLSVLFAQDTMFAFPGLFLVIGIDALRARRYRHLVAAAGAAIVTAGVIASLYFFVWSRINSSKESRYWGKKYDVFYVPSDAVPNKADWMLDRYAALVEDVGARRQVWHSRRVSEETLSELGSVDQATWLVLDVVGLAMLARRRNGRDALLYALPLAVTAFMNWHGFWPFGPFRTNLFTLVYAAAIASAAVDRDAKRARFGDLLPASVFVLLPLFAFERTWHGKKEMLTLTNPTEFPTAFKELLSLQGADYSGPREKILVDNMGCDPWRYYTRYQPSFSKVWGSQLRRRFAFRCTGGPDRAAALTNFARKTLRKHPRVWILATDDRVIEDFDRNWPEDLKKDVFERVGDNQHLILAVTLPEAPPPPPTEQAAPEPPPSADLPGDPESESHDVP